MTLPTITMHGNLVADPEMRFTQSGAEVVKFRVACGTRVFDRQANEWKDGQDRCFLDVEVWRNQANNVVESLVRGTSVVVTGELRQRNYETQAGEKRSVYEVINPTIAVSLDNQTAVVTKVRRNVAPATAQAAPAPQTAPAAQPPAQAAPAATQPAAAPPATPATQPVPAGAGTGFLDEPPF